jgi:uncharacterized protein YigE (DUF2233 family)
MLRLAALLTLLAGPASALSCERVTWQETRFSLCRVDPARDDLRLFHSAADGAPLGDFSSIEAETGRNLAFAMNAGMYHDDLRPVGYYLENGEQKMWLVTQAGPGNFGLLPNGVLCIGNAGAQVIESARLHLCHAIRSDAGDRRRASSAVSSRRNLAADPQWRWHERRWQRGGFCHV